MNWSDFGHKLTSRSGILELMDDLGKAMQAQDTGYMLGGGNPASIDQVNQVWRRRMEEIMANGDEFEKGLANYDTPQGKNSFLTSVANLLRKEYNWDLGPQNIAVTNGSQSAFFMLFNLLSGQLDESRGQGLGQWPEPTHKKILLPLTPEYIGYADQGIGEDHFLSHPPKIELIGEDQFKYRIDFDSLEITEDIAAICVSRPTNPTGNVLSDEEVRRLDELARKHQIPLMIDNAYGTPFPNILFTEATPIWNENIILGLSLSKLGLPSTRTGILVAHEKVIQAVTAVNAIMSLANSTLGQMITQPLMESGEILTISREVIQPFYKEKSEKAQASVRRHFKGIPYRIHVSQGALFLWLWLPGLGIDTMDLYNRLKLRKTIVVPGKYFFFGINDKTHNTDWEHSRECIRISFAQEESQVDKGLEIIADEIRNMLKG